MLRRLAAFGLLATIAIRLCCAFDLLGTVLLHQSVDFLLKTVKPVQEHLRVSPNFNAGDVVPRNFFTGLFAVLALVSFFFMPDMRAQNDFLRAPPSG